MNYIKKLEEENKQLKETMEYTVELLIEHLRYYSSEKFRNFENDFAHVSTDVYPKINCIKMILAGTLNSDKLLTN